MLFFGLNGYVEAQDSSPPSAPPLVDAISAPPLTAGQDRELKAWVSAMEKWLRDETKWHNRVKHDDWGRVVARRPRPDAPSWLAGYCASAAGAADLSERTSKACRLHADPQAEIASTRAAKPQIDAEKPPKHSSFLTRVHLDGLWTTASTDGRIYGLIGSHISLVDVGRLQIFGPPGVILLSVPDGGSRRISLGYTWGVSIRLADVRVFAPTKNMTLFLNMSKVWVGGEAGDQRNTRGFDIVGFSLAPRKKR
jgi:hypothetical protein